MLLLSHTYLVPMNFNSTNPFLEFFYNKYYASPLTTSKIIALSNTVPNTTVNTNVIPEMVVQKTINKKSIKIPQKSIKNKNFSKICQYCDENFANSRSLHNHERFFCKTALENGIIQKNYRCPNRNCPKKFTRNYELKVHIKKCKHRNDKNEYE